MVQIGRIRLVAKREENSLISQNVFPNNPLNYFNALHSGLNKLNKMKDIQGVHANCTS